MTKSQPVTNADILEAINDFREEVRQTYVTKDTFNGHLQAEAPVKNLVYGMVGVILLAVLGALTALVIRTQ